MTAANSSFQAIIAATEALIAEKGCRQTTLQDIIQRTGLSKGAIYHYVSSKDELLGLVLKSQIEQVNERFTKLVNEPGTIGLDSPLQLIAEGMIRGTSSENVTNKIFIYLLSTMDNPKVAAIVREIYGYTLHTCAGWIESGKQNGVIPAGADSAKIAESLVMFMQGMRVQNAIMPENGQVTVQWLIAFMRRALS
jgi:AcrR family transcriptional regulator